MKTKIIIIILLGVMAIGAEVAYYVQLLTAGTGPIIVHHKAISTQQTGSPAATGTAYGSASSSTPLSYPSASTSEQNIYKNGQNQTNYQMVLPKGYKAQTNNGAFRMETVVRDPNLPESQNFIFSLDVSFVPVTFESPSVQLLNFAQNEIGPGSIVSYKNFQGGLLVTARDVPRYYFFILNHVGLGADFSSPRDYFGSQEFLNILASFKFQ